MRTRNLFDQPVGPQHRELAGYTRGLPAAVDRVRVRAIQGLANVAVAEPRDQRLAGGGKGDKSNFR